MPCGVSVTYKFQQMKYSINGKSEHNALREYGISVSCQTCVLQISDVHVQMYPGMAPRKIRSCAMCVLHDGPALDDEYASLGRGKILFTACKRFNTFFFICCTFGYAYVTNDNALWHGLYNDLLRYVGCMRIVHQVLCRCIYIYIW